MIDGTLRNCFWGKSYTGHLKSSFDEIFLIVSHTATRFSFNIRNYWWITLLPWKKNSKFPLLGRKQPWKHRLKTNAYWKINFCWFFEKDIGKQKFFSKSAIFIKISLWKLRMLLRQLRPNHSTKWLKVFRLMSQNRGKKFGLFPRMCSTGHVESKFDNPVGKLCWTGRKFFAQCQGTWKKFSFPREKSIQLLFWTHQT